MTLRYGFSVLALGLVLAVLPAAAQDYDAYLDGLQEVPPNASPATGAALLTLDGAKMLSYNISYADLLSTEFAAHVHIGAPGVNGGIVFALPTGTPKVGSYGPLTAQEEADLNAGLWYINIHTTPGFSGGEIRGQISSAPVTTERTSWSRIKSLYTR